MTGGPGGAIGAAVKEKAGKGKANGPVGGLMGGGRPRSGITRKLLGHAFDKCVLLGV